MSYLCSAWAVRRLRTPEPLPPVRSDDDNHWRREVTAGWRYIAGQGALAALFANALIFGGCISATSSLMAVFMLRDLGLQPWQYGVALGVPGLGGIIGSVVARPIADRWGRRRAMLTFGVVRTMWMGLIPVAPSGSRGLVLILVSETLLLSSAGVFNPLFTAFRWGITADDHLARVLTAWSISAKTVQPVFILAAGALAVMTSVRTAIAAAAVILLLSGVLLPWRQGED